MNRRSFLQSLFAIPAVVALGKLFGREPETWGTSAVDDPNFGYQYTYTYRSSITGCVSNPQPVVIQGESMGLFIPDGQYDQIDIYLQNRSGKYVYQSTLPVEV